MLRVARVAVRTTSGIRGFGAVRPVVIASMLIPSGSGSFIRLDRFVPGLFKRRTAAHRARGPADSAGGYGGKPVGRASGLVAGVNPAPSASG